MAEPDDAAHEGDASTTTGSEGGESGRAVGAVGAEPDGIAVGSPVLRRSRGYLAVLGVLTAVIVVLVGFGAALGLRVLQADEEQARRETVLQTARQFALDLTTLEYRTVDRDVQRLLERSTEQFAEQFGLSGTAFVDVAKQSQLVSTSEISTAGVERVDENSARVLVAVNATVRDINLPQGTPRNYRLAVELVWSSPRWLVSSVEFIL